MKRALGLCFFLLTVFSLQAQTFSRDLVLSKTRMNGDDVTALQKKLLELGYAGIGEADGWFGPNTEEAVKKLQSWLGFDKTGKVTKQVWNAVFNSRLDPQYFTLLKSANLLQIQKLKKVEKELMGHSTEGGRAELYSSESELKYAHINLCGEMGQVTYELFLFENSVFLMLEEKVRYPEQFNIEHASYEYTAYVYSTAKSYMIKDGAAQKTTYDSKDILKLLREENKESSLKSNIDHIYFGNIINEKIILLDINTGKTINPIPAGYQIVAPLSYHPLSGVILLRKLNSLFVFRCDTGSIETVKAGFLKDGEQIYTVQSVSDGNDLIIGKFTTKKLNEIDTLYTYTDFYYLNLRNKQFTQITGPLRDFIADDYNIIIYDSKTNVIYSWQAGEGEYTPLPVVEVDLGTGKKKEIIGKNIFSEEKLLSIEYYGRFLIGIPQIISETFQVFVYSLDSNKLRLIQIDPKYRDLDIGSYSAIYDDKNDHVIIGQHDGILLLKISNDSVADTQVHNDRRIYLNRMYLISNRIIYQSNGKINIFNAADLKLMKSYPIAGVNKSTFDTEFGIFRIGAEIK